VRFNLSSVYNGLGRNAEAITLLKEVAEIDPKNGRTYYNLGLLYYEEQQKEEALLSFEKALKLGYNRPEVYYNYGLLLQQLGKDKQAESLLLRGYQKFPAAENLNYALAYFYLKKGNKAAAFKHVNFLRQLAPNNPKYTDLFGIM
jgi:Flp pilus assembly protein TadD